MISVKKAYAEDFDRILPLLKEFNNSHQSAEDWHRMFQNNWVTDTKYIGYMLTDNEDIVGFYGLLFSNPIIGGHRYLLCNFTSWIVKEKYRSYAISMLSPLLSLTKFTITNISATPNVRQIFKKMGFKEIQRKWHIFLPFSLLQELSLLRCNFYEGKIIEKFLSGETLQIYRDHCHLPICFHLLVTYKDQTSYILITKTIRKYLPFARIHYISNPDIFLRFYSKIVRHICWQVRTVASILDENLLQNRPMPWCLSMYPTPILYKPATQAKEQIGTIYSEEVVLG